MLSVVYIGDHKISSSHSLCKFYFSFGRNSGPQPRVSFRADPRAGITWLTKAEGKGLLTTTRSPTTLKSLQVPWTSLETSFFSEPPSSNRPWHKKLTFYTVSWNPKTVRTRRCRRRHPLQLLNFPPSSKDLLQSSTSLIQASQVGLPNIWFPRSKDRPNLGLRC